MRLAWQNLADDATITADSELAEQPASNVQSAHLSRKWATAASVNDSGLVFDMGETVSCDTLALLGTNLTSAATVRLRASDTDAAAESDLELDTTVLAAGVKAGYGAVYKGFTSSAARYWRLNVADASLPDNLQVGRIFLGPSWEPSVPQDYGWSVTPVDPSQIAKSYGGQTYADALPQIRVLNFQLSWLDEAEMYGNAFAMARAAGIVKDVLAIHDLAGDWLSEQAVWGRCSQLYALTRKSLKLFQQKFQIEERL